LMSMSVFRTKISSGVLFALFSAALFGASTPLSKILLGDLNPVLLAGLLYLSSGCGLTIWRLLRRLFCAADAHEASLKSEDLPWLAGAVLAGGVIGPALLMIGLVHTPASSASLLLNLEGVFTATLAWFVYKESFDRRIASGMVAIVAGGLLLSWTGKPELNAAWGNLSIIGACFAWGIDNNLTRKVSATDPTQIAAIKGFIAGAVNLAIALMVGARIPGAFAVAFASLVGFLGYGVSLSLFILALRHIGTARTGAYFSSAPFVGAVVSILVLGDKITTNLIAAAALMGLGVWLHLTEVHEHEHWHPQMIHEHRHSHDEHHQHEHEVEVSPGESHSHEHAHVGLLHRHPHYPDIHHRH
jgi:drug/metabolite transporter (DMT)-like permease